MLLGGFCLFTLASMACGLAPSIGVLVAARAAQGAGAAALGACSLALLGHTFPGPAERARAVGLWAAGASAALAAGPLAGGLLIATVGWRFIFFINAPLGLAGFWLTARHAAETPRARDRGVDLPGQLSAVLALTALAGATISIGSRGLSALAAGGYVLAVGAGTAFVIVERRSARPMVPPALFRSRMFSAAIGVGFVINIVFYGLIFVFSLFLQRQERLSPLAAGLAFVPVMLAIMASNVLAGRGIRVTGVRQVIGAGALILSAACLLLAVSVRSLPLAGLVAEVSLAGFGVGLIVPAMTSAVLGGVERSRSGIASGALTAARQTGSVLGVALFGSLVAGAGGVSVAGGLRTAMMIAVVLGLAVAGLSSLINAPRA